MTLFRAWTIVALGLMAGAVQGQATTGSAERQMTDSPNIVFIFADDMGYGDLSCYGQTEYTTPHLDKMASEGVRLTEFYVTSPACSPARASLLTGQYPMRAGVPNVLGPESMRGLHQDAPLLPEVMKQEGYASAIIGKWHLGFTPEFVPTNKGFDYFYGLPYSNDMEPCALIRGTEIIESPANQETLTKRYTDEALKFIDRSTEDSKPFFLYFAHSFPHVPLFVSDEFKGSSGAGLYGDVIKEIDWSVGQVIKHLEEKKLTDNTLVIFTSDNGPWMIKGDQAGTAGDLRGSKGMDFEGGVRVPFIARWPGRLPEGKVVEIPAIISDMMPTLTNLVGGTLPDAKYDGKDVWPVLAEGRDIGERLFHFPDYYYRNQVGAVRKGDWKLLTAREKKGRWDARTTELINLKTDPNERNNVADQHPELVEELTQEADRMRAELHASNPWGENVDRKSKEALKYVTKDSNPELGQAGTGSRRNEASKPDPRIRYRGPLTQKAQPQSPASPQNTPAPSPIKSKRYPILIYTPIPDDPKVGLKHR